MWEVDAPLSNDFCGRADKRRVLADVLDITGNPEVNESRPMDLRLDHNAS